MPVRTDSSLLSTLDKFEKKGILTFDLLDSFAFHLLKEYFEKWKEAFVSSLERASVIF